MNTPNSTGEAWDKLEEKVDGFVEALIKEKNLPGMTVAVTKQGRLLLSKGYGSALVDGTRKLPMKPCSRSRIGSVTKAVITGPSAFQLMELHKIDRKSTKLYGAKGFFGGIFDADIDIGIKTNSPDSTQWKEWYKKTGIKTNALDSTHWKEWYEKITIQDLLDHTAGFMGDGKDKEAAEMFDVSMDELTYEQIHRHFLRTRILLQPGTFRYSNHSVGLLTLLRNKK
jgi:CubicO group peptidase (beta-lactamase class C family)